MTCVVIHTTAQGFRVGINRRGEIKGSSLNVSEYAKKFKQWDFDKQAYRWVLKNEFFRYDEKSEICFFPKFDLDGFKAFLEQNGVRYEVKALDPVSGVVSEYHMLPHITYKNEKQKGAVEYLTNDTAGRIRGLALQTGEGKTVSYIWSVQKWSVRSMITMTSRLEQWARELGNYTTLDEDDIYLVQGVASLTKLFAQIDKDIKPKFILASSKTIRLYLDYGPGYQHLPPPHEMCEKLGIGIVGTDEYHEHFMTNFLIGITLNPALFIPITATFVASDPFVKNIFDQFVPKDVQFYGGDYNKFVSVTAYQYTSGGHLIKPFHYTSPRGYSQQIFEKSLLGRLRKVLDSLVEDAFIPIINEHYVQIAEPGEKLLFLCSSTKLCDHLVNIFSRVFPTKKVTAFYSGIPESVLKEYDIILSTPGSAGTGRDIKGLRTCFVFESVDSEARNLQFIGRLRGPPQMMNEPQYVYLSFSCIPQHVKYHTSRSILYGPRAKKFRHRSIH